MRADDFADRPQSLVRLPPPRVLKPSALVERSALRARPHGFVHLHEVGEEFFEALRHVAAGRQFLSPWALPLAERVLEGEPPAELSPRESRTLQMIGEGLPTKQIAGCLGTSEKTVENIRAALMRKLGARDAAGLIRAAVRLGLVS